CRPTKYEHDAWGWWEADAWAEHGATTLPSLTLTRGAVEAGCSGCAKTATGAAMPGALDHLRALIAGQYRPRSICPKVNSSIPQGLWPGASTKCPGAMEHASAVRAPSAPILVCSPSKAIRATAKPSAWGKTRIGAEGARTA